MPHTVERLAYTNWPEPVPTLGRSDAAARESKPSDTYCLSMRCVLKYDPLIAIVDRMMRRQASCCRIEEGQNHLLQTLVE